MFFKEPAAACEGASLRWASAAAQPKRHPADQPPDMGICHRQRGQFLVKKRMERIMER